jgi:GT2 family glycosyltransferase
LSLSIIIVNYRSSKDIGNCLASAMSFGSRDLFEWIILDNNSDDNGKETITGRFPFVKWIQINYNAGYARANNEGIRQAASDVILLLNPDVLFEDDSLQKCYQSFIRSEYVACNVQLLNTDRSPQISGGYFIKGGLNNLLPLPVLGIFFKALGNLFRVRKTSLKNAQDVQEVDWINGAFVMVKKEAIERAGLLDEDFFLYAEEIEWCSRLRKIGKIAVFGKSHAIHLQAESANRAFGSLGKGYYNLYDKKGRQIMLSNFVRIRKQFGAGWFLFHLLCYLLEIPFFFLFVTITTVLFLKTNYTFSKLGGYISNLFYLVSKSGIILRNKPYFYKAM